MAGVDSRRLLLFSERCGDADLLRFLTADRAAESSLGVGLGARLDGMLIPSTSDMKSSPRYPNANHCKLWSNQEGSTNSSWTATSHRSNHVMKACNLMERGSCCHSTISPLSPNTLYFPLRQLLHFRKCPEWLFWLKPPLTKERICVKFCYENCENC
jgi:hypothetical protein